MLLGQASGDEIDESLAPQFKQLSIIILCLGIFFTLIFHVGTKEEVNRENKSVEDGVTSEAQSTSSKSRKEWLKDMSFYTTALVYVFTRVAVVVFQSSYVSYLTEAIHFKKVR